MDLRRRDRRPWRIRRTVTNTFDGIEVGESWLDADRFVSRNAACIACRLAAEGIADARLRRIDRDHAEVWLDGGRIMTFEVVRTTREGIA